MRELVQTLIAEPLIAAMAEDEMPYQGVLYIGVMIQPSGPKVVEFNVRFGDPECQALMASLEGDIVPALLICATGGLALSHREIADMMGLSDPKPAVSVVMATEGYPGRYGKGSVIKGVDDAEAIEGVTVFQAGTDMNAAGELTATGGRVLSVTATGETLQAARDQAYAGVDAIDWPEGFSRKDIAWRALK